MLGIIPVIMVAVAARQLYLSKTDDLSTWKGGGMGMFAGSETTHPLHQNLFDLSRWPPPAAHAANRPTRGAQDASAQLPERTEYAGARSVHQGHHLVGEHHAGAAQCVWRGRAESFKTAPTSSTIFIRRIRGPLRSRPSGASRSSIGRRPTTPRRGSMSGLSRARSNSRAEANDERHRDRWPDSAR